MKEEIFLIDLNLDFGNFYKFSTNFYLETNYLNFSFFWNDMEDYYDLIIYSDGTLIYQGVLRFFNEIPSFFGYRTERESLKPKGKFLFLPKNINHSKNESNIRIKDFQDFNFNVFFIKS